MFATAYSDGHFYRVPGGELLWLDLDGSLIGVKAVPAYWHADGSFEPGQLISPVKTDIRFTHYHEDGGECRVRPVVCRPCGDTGQSPDYTTAGSDECESCYGWAYEKNLHVCALCGRHSFEVLPVAPRETLNHELLLARMHPACAVELLREEVR